jgi:hypothetical protein
MKKSKVVVMTLSLPKEIRRWLEGQAATDFLSMNDVICQTLRSRMTEQQRETERA